MSITDELREWVTGAKPAVVDGCSISVGTMTYGCKKALLAIADSIDAEHERAVTAAHSNGITEYGSMVAREYVKLPVDEDGVPIHIGDVMEGVDKYDSLKKVMGEVTTISFDATYDPDDSRSVGIRVWSDDRRSYHIAYLDPRASVYRHYHAPTVEDVLTEFGIDWEHESDCEDRAALLKEYAAKLQLREDA